MRILSTNFKNIKSLKGEFRIDFQDRQYLDNGIFVITGDTGAGKTTILDAIKLSLYPSSNFEILMSKGTGECFSSTDFEVDGVIYRATVGLRRARGKADGAIQGATCSLVDLNSGEELTNKMKEFRTRIPAITKLTVEQFTSSVILSQGEFDKFLKADEKSKAAILEEITNTEIYSDIGIKIYNKFTEEKSELKALEDQLNGKKPLTAEERTDLESGLKAVMESLAESEEKIQALKTAKQWFSEKHEWDRSMSALKDDIQNNENAIFAFSSEKERLDLSRKASRSRELKVSFDNLSANRAAEESSIGCDKAELEENGTRLSEAEEKLSRAKEEADKLSALARSERELAIQVRDLDGKIRLADGQLSSIGQQISESDPARDRERLKGLEWEGKELAAKLEGIQNEFNAYPFLPELEAQYSLIENAYNQSCDLSRKGKELRQLIDDAAKADAEAGNVLNEIGNAIAANHAILDECENTIRTLFEKPVNNPEYAFNLASEVLRLENELSYGNDKVRELEDLLKQARREAETKKGIKEDKERIARLSNDNATLFSLLQELREGGPCPLCGSFDHPNILTLPDDEEMLRINFEVQRAATEYNDAVLNVEDLSSSFFREKAAFDAGVARYNRDLEELCRLGVTEQICETTVGKLGNLIANINSSNALMNEGARLDREYNQRSFEKNEAWGKLQYLIESEKTVHDNYDGAWNTVSTALGKYGADNFEQLRMKLERGRDLRDRIAEIDGKLNEARNEYAYLSNTVSDKEARLTKLMLDKAEIDERRAALSSERMRLYGTDDPDQRVKEAGDKEAEASRRVTSLETDIGHFKENKIRLEKKIKDGEGRLTNLFFQEAEAKTAFFSSINDSGFSDAASWEAALLDAKEEERLADEDNRLCGEKQKLLGRKTALEDNGARLDARKAMLYPVVEENITAELEGAEAEKKRLDEHKMECSNAIAADDRVRSESSELSARIETKRSKVDLYRSLNELAGASDGATFRKYAQSLTFRNLVAHANRQLANMYPRYSLIQQKESPLILSVRDSYQAGGVRSVNSLSGGERFIVSLALALGLSDMSSGSIRIDTFFLDEGFGTLSSELLDEVLESLTALSSSGKLIGLISHVEKLKENIRTAIEVRPIGVSGFSTLSGPGVNAKI